MNSPIPVNKYLDMEGWHGKKAVTTARYCPKKSTVSSWVAVNAIRPVFLIFTYTTDVNGPVTCVYQWQPHCVEVCNVVEAIEVMIQRPRL